MMNLIVLRRNEREEDNMMYIIEGNKFETVLLSECYDKFGQKIGKENAEDYCLENNYCTELREKFLSDLRVAGFEVEEDAVEDIIESEDNSVKEFVENWRDENEAYTEALAYNYWDGNNWRSIILDDDANGYSVNYEKVEQELAEKVLAAYENALFPEYEFGKSEVESDGFVFLKTQYPGDPFLTTVEL